MKKLITLFLLTVAGATQAQQTSYLGLYYANPFVLNPSAAGLNDHTQAFLHYRKQWVGIEGAPETQAFTADWKIPNQSMGLGVQVNREVNNFFNRTSFKLAYAYHINLNDRHDFHLGLAAGIIQNNLNWQNIQANMGDPLLVGSTHSSSRFDADFGFQYVFDKRLEIGFIAQQMVRSAFKYEDAEAQVSLTYRLINQYTSVVGYRFNFKDGTYGLKPLVMLRSAQGLPFQFEIGAAGYYKELAFVGLNYRDGIGFAASAGLHLAKRYQIGYLFEYANSQLGTQSVGSHEIVLGIKLGGGAAALPNKELKELQKQNAMLYEKIDMLEQEKEALKKRVDGLEKLKDDAKKNESALKEEEKRQVEKAARINVDVAQNTDENSMQMDTDFDDKLYDFQVVLGSFGSIENAKQMQKIVKREFGKETQVMQDGESNFYHVAMPAFGTQKEAVLEIMALVKADKNQVFNGNPWIKPIEIK